MKIKLKDNTIFEATKIVGENINVTTFEIEGKLVTIKNSDIIKMRFSDGSIFEKNYEKHGRPN